MVLYALGYERNAMLEFIDVDLTWTEYVHKIITEVNSMNLPVFCALELEIDYAIPELELELDDGEYDCKQMLLIHKKLILKIPLEFGIEMMQKTAFSKLVKELDLSDDKYFRGHKLGLEGEEAEFFCLKQLKMLCDSLLLKCATKFNLERVCHGLDCKDVFCDEFMDEVLLFRGVSYKHKFIVEGRKAFVDEAHTLSSLITASQMGFHSLLEKYEHIESRCAQMRSELDRLLPKYLKTVGSIGIVYEGTKVHISDENTSIQCLNDALFVTLFNARLLQYDKARILRNSARVIVGHFAKFGRISKQFDKIFSKYKGEGNFSIKIQQDISLDEKLFSLDFEGSEEYKIATDLAALGLDMYPRCLEIIRNPLGCRRDIGISIGKPSSKDSALDYESGLASLLDEQFSIQGVEQQETKDVEQQETTLEACAAGLPSDLPNSLPSDLPSSYYERVKAFVYAQTEAEKKYNASYIDSNVEKMIMIRKIMGIENYHARIAEDIEQEASSIHVSVAEEPSPITGITSAKAHINMRFLHSKELDQVRDFLDIQNAKNPADQHQPLQNQGITLKYVDKLCGIVFVMMYEVEDDSKKHYYHSHTSFNPHQSLVQFMSQDVSNLSCRPYLVGRVMDNALAYHSKSESMERLAYKPFKEGEDEDSASASKQCLKNHRCTDPHAVQHVKLDDVLLGNSPHMIGKFDAYTQVKTNYKEELQGKCMTLAGEDEQQLTAKLQCTRAGYDTRNGRSIRD